MKTQSQKVLLGQHRNLVTHSLGIQFLYSSMLMPGDNDSFAMEILSQNHREINITEAILVSRKLIITCIKGFPDNDIMRIPLM